MKTFMKTLKISAAALFMVGLMAMMAPVGVLAAHQPHKKVKVVTGTLCTYTAGVSATINLVAANCGTTTDVTVNLNKHTRLVDESTPVAAPVAGDSAAAFLRWHKGKAIAKKLEYGTSLFAYAHHEFAGKYVSSTGDCTSGTLTINGLGSKKKGVSDTFTTDSNTKYRSNGSSATCAAVTGAYKVGERINVAGREMTDGSLYAKLVNAKTNKGKH